MTTLPARGKITDWLVEELSQFALVGDGEAPYEGGWTEAEDEFVGYAVLVEAPAQINHRGSVGDPEGSWAIGYTLRCVGGSRRHVAAIADSTREAIAGLYHHRLLAPDTWGVEKVQINSLGGAVRIDQTDPKQWETSDSLALWLSRDD